MKKIALVDFDNTITDLTENGIGYRIRLLMHLKKFDEVIIVTHRCTRKIDDFKIDPLSPKTTDGLIQGFNNKHSKNGIAKHKWASIEGAMEYMFKVGIKINLVNVSTPFDVADTTYLKDKTNLYVGKYYHDVLIHLERNSFGKKSKLSSENKKAIKLTDEIIKNVYENQTLFNHFFANKNKQVLSVIEHLSKKYQDEPLVFVFFDDKKEIQDELRLFLREDKTLQDKLFIANTHIKNLDDVDFDLDGVDQWLNTKITAHQKLHEDAKGIVKDLIQLSFLKIESKDKPNTNGENEIKLIKESFFQYMI